MLSNKKNGCILVIGYCRTYKKQYCQITRKQTIVQTALSYKHRLDFSFETVNTQASTFTGSNVIN